jgi:hypothetical protein
MEIIHFRKLNKNHQDMKNKDRIAVTKNPQRKPLKKESLQF